MLLLLGHLLGVGGVAWIGHEAPIGKEWARSRTMKPTAALGVVAVHYRTPRLRLPSGQRHCSPFAVFGLLSDAAGQFDGR